MTKSRRPPDLSPRPLGVKEIPTDQLFPNPHNPRLLFDKAPLKILEESIAKVGILVPLTVYRESRTGRHIILDGQRRWIVAQRLNLELVPVNEVAEPTLVQNIVTMFQIHKLREDWELMPSALKLEMLMKALSERNEAKLAALTGLDKAVVARCKKLLGFPRKYQDMMLEPDETRRVKADFFIELYAVRNDRFVNSMEWFARDDFTDRMLSRYQSKKGIRAVTDFRKVKQFINNARLAGEAEQISRRLHEFAMDDSLGLEHLAIRAASVAQEAKKIETTVVSLHKTLRSLDASVFYGEESLWEQLEALVETIRRRLEDAGRRPAS